MKLVLSIVLGFFSTFTYASDGCRCQNHNAFCDNGDLVTCYEERDETTTVCVLSTIKENASECPQTVPAPRGPSGDPSNG